MSKKDKTVSQKILHILPGLGVCIGITIISKILGKYVPSLGAATISLYCLFIGCLQIVSAIVLIWIL